MRNDISSLTGPVASDVQIQGGVWCWRTDPRPRVKARYAVIFSSGKSFQSPANSRSDRLPRASLRTTSLKLSPSFLTWASATYASSDRVKSSSQSCPRGCRRTYVTPSRPLDESHYVQAAHRPTPRVRSLLLYPVRVLQRPPDIARIRAYMHGCIHGLDGRVCHKRSSVCR